MPENYHEIIVEDGIIKKTNYKIGDKITLDLENDDNDAIVRGLPKGTIFAHKTGSLTKIRHDGGIVFSGIKYIIIQF